MVVVVIIVRVSLRSQPAHGILDGVAGIVFEAGTALDTDCVNVLQVSVAVNSSLNPVTVSVAVAVHSSLTVSDVVRGKRRVSEIFWENDDV